MEDVQPNDVEIIFAEPVNTNGSFSGLFLREDAHMMVYIREDMKLSFIDHLVMMVVYTMQYSGERKLPRFKRTELYETLMKEFKHIYLNETPSSLPYVMFTWRPQHRFAMARKVPPFANVSQCELRKVALTNAINSGENTTDIKTMSDYHVEFVCR